MLVDVEMRFARHHQAPADLRRSLHAVTDGACCTCASTMLPETLHKQQAFAYITAQLVEVCLYMLSAACCSSSSPHAPSKCFFPLLRICIAVALQRLLCGSRHQQLGRHCATCYTPHTVLCLLFVCSPCSPLLVSFAHLLLFLTLLAVILLSLLTLLFGLSSACLRCTCIIPAAASMWTVTSTVGEDCATFQIILPAPFYALHLHCCCPAAASTWTVTSTAGEARATRASAWWCRQRESRQARLRSSECGGPTTAGCGWS
jgi:hypothetical protein